MNTLFCDLCALCFAQSLDCHLRFESGWILIQLLNDYLVLVARSNFKIIEADTTVVVWSPVGSIATEEG